MESRVIDPKANTIVARHKLTGGDSPHKLLIEASFVHPFAFRKDQLQDMG
jgi:hypothetical protein